MKSNRKPASRSAQKRLLLLSLSRVRYEQLAKLGALYWDHVRALKEAERAALAAERLVAFALRDPERTLATYQAFVDYCVAEAFSGIPARDELLDRQIEQAWGRSKQARALARILKPGKHRRSTGGAR